MPADAPLLLALDAGTGSCRAILFDPAGAEVASASREYTHPEVPGIPGSQEFEVDRAWGLIGECVRQCLALAKASPARVRAVSCTSMREGMVLYDAAGREIWACPNADSRSRQEVEELVASGEAEEIYSIGGDWAAITAPARFRWLAKHAPDVFKRIAHMGMLGDWIAYRLSGVHVTDPSLGSSSGMFDLAERAWSGRVVELCGLDPDVFPPVLDPGTVAGAVTPEAAEATGLAPGTPVVVGGADTQLGLTGIGVSAPGSFTLVGGSFWQLTGVWETIPLDPQRRLRTLCHSQPNQWMIEGIGFYSGLAMRWLRDAFYAREAHEALLTGDDVYSLMEADAKSVPAGANGIFGLFSNEMDAKRWIHAAPGFVGFDITRPATSGRRECFRAVQESAAYAAFGHLRTIEAIAAAEAKELIFTGGAARGRVWAQVVADVFGLPTQIPVVKESTALGAAIFAGIGSGIYANVEEAASRVVRFERTIDPDPAAHETYAGLYEQWRGLYQNALDLTDASSLRPLWRAAGT